MKIMRLYQIILVCSLSLLSSFVWAQPRLQVIPETVDFGEVEPYSPAVSVESITISNCGDSILCWGVEADNDWLSVESESMGMIDLSEGDSKYVKVNLGACGLCIVPQLQDEGKDPVGIHAGKFIVKQYEYDDLTESCNPYVVLNEIEINTTMTIAEYNMLRVEPNELNFGSIVDEDTFTVMNKGQGEMVWVASVPEGIKWLTIDGQDITDGTIVSGGAQTVTVRVDRSQMEGCAEKYSASIKVTSENASPSEAAVSVTMQKDILPPQPSYPTPADGSVGQPLYATLKWWEGETVEDVGGIVHFDVYFSPDRELVESESFSVLVCEDLDFPYCDPNKGGGELAPNTTYYWKVRASDECAGGVPYYSELWSFTTTASLPTNACMTSLALPLKSSEMTLLRNFRDEVLTKSNEGEKVINLYYSPYAIEALVILFFNPEMRACAHDIVKELLPAIRSRIMKRNPAITMDTVEKIKQLLKSFEDEASPSLREVVNGLKQEVVSGELFEKLGFAVTKR